MTNYNDNSFKVDLKELYAEYELDRSILSEQSEEYSKILRVMEQKLDKVDRLIMLMYAELGSVKKVGDILHISQSTAYNEIKRIKNLIKEWL